MGKRYWTGDRQPARLRDGRHRLCISCTRPIVYGERCPNCQQNLRARRKRKPR